MNVRGAPHNRPGGPNYRRGLMRLWRAFSVCWSAVALFLWADTGGVQYPHWNGYNWYETPAPWVTALVAAAPWLLSLVVWGICWVGRGFKT
ncbi:MAG: hypothetical protein KGL39_43000 [Patescibacteria group bacterium]|nr:hypothetical protein [Patescibacteria group bacterium]